jgi:predicted HD superfamily hydrolase involved in NAD metabolism
MRSQIDISDIKKSLEKHQDPERFEHTLGVSYTAAALAMRYGYDIKKAQLAGLLHDCAKHYSEEKILQYCEKYNISITEVEWQNPFLLHAKLGAFLAMHKYHVTDEEIISAILVHTTGKPNMNLLDKILYVADYIEPNRNKAEHLQEIRQLAFVDLDQALVRILEDTVQYLKKKDCVVDPMSAKTLVYYKEKMEEK